ncbi:MAG: hypothetical protein HQ567_33490 [Candidatus Nealsonbacteria bacterium]|nr:hypothetical protein [Candidatus Nealsonbacteria bacterium]
MNEQIVWPEGKKFAFTVFDDTDLANLENVSPVYKFLSELGFRTTKSVWAFSGDLEKASCPGATCQDEEYRQWLLGLQEEGFEIGWHGATYHASTREETIRGLDEFKTVFGQDPMTYAVHVGNYEGMYFGEPRLTGVNALAYTLLTRFKQWRKFRGHREGDPLFWGDVCKERVKYCRNFVFPGINTLRECPCMPYFNPARPYVNYWFASSEGAGLESFNRTLHPDCQDILEEQRGACIMYTHFGNGFCRDGKLDEVFQRQLERLAGKDGWFVPVATLLDFIIEQRGHHEISRAERSKLERKWLAHKIRIGTS